MAALVKRTPGSVGYMTLHAAKKYKMNIGAQAGVSFLQDGGYLNPTLESINQALLVGGENFGGIPFDSDTNHLTANIAGNPASQGLMGTEAWSIAAYVYLGIRTNTAGSGFHLRRQTLWSLPFCAVVDLLPDGPQYPPN